nr:hypothetical protein [Kineosporia mesophila]
MVTRLEKKSLLRIGRRRLAGAHPEEFGIEPVNARQHAAGGHETGFTVSCLIHSGCRKLGFAEVMNA